MPALLFLLLFLAPPDPRRPHIIGIDHVVLLARDPDISRPFYLRDLQLSQQDQTGDPEALTAYWLNASQYIGLARLQGDHVGRIDHIAFATDDVEALRRSLSVRGVSVPDHVTVHLGIKSFRVSDPEGNRLEFAEAHGVRLPDFGYTNPPLSTHLLHAGFIVHDRAAEDRFYRDLLGFKLYWHGGMKDGDTDWVDMQVPDGTDWIEYMLNAPADPDPRLAGILDHVALAVPDVRAAAAQLKDIAKEKPQIGRDGKWQLNLYDPDLTRVELMEPTPVAKPCCAPYTAPHPVLPSPR